MLIVVEIAEIRENEHLNLDANIVSEKLKRINEEEFKFPQLQPWQLEAAVSMVNKRDTIVIQPTGAGKTASFLVSYNNIHVQLLRVLLMLV